ncbi:MAG: hypothetical protein VKP62_05155 [Candidatus Sericytochromatia bacterium]|nr:hypothetical protein [Candidatus Sericytochromatia bacterium]
MFPLDTAVPAYALAHVGLLAGIALIVLRPFSPGVLVSAGSALAYVAYAVSMSPVSRLNLAWPAGVVLALAALSWLAPRWSARLGVLYGLPNPRVVMGSFFGMVLFALLFRGGLFVQVAGLLVGSLVAAWGQPRATFRTAWQAGPVAFYTMLGPRGFQLLLALLLADVAIQYLLHRVGLASLSLHL